MMFFTVAVLVGLFAGVSCQFDFSPGQQQCIIDSFENMALATTVLAACANDGVPISGDQVRIMSYV